MSHTAIRIEGLGKRYVIGKMQNRQARQPLWRRATSTFDYLATTLHAPDEAETLWALRDISFDVQQGEVIGIVGHNGAGKSTLLKILSRVTDPTEGRATIQGRVGSLLEVGTGFNPHLTGRENIFLNGAILGMRKSEIDRKFDEIVAFAGVEKFIDTQVKRYSSGMGVRLAFAVAAHLEPEVLVIDEVLAVGDAAFQRKCLTKMNDVAEEGRTILFVSHNMVAVQNLCARVVWLESGGVVQIGKTDAVVPRYLKSMMLDTGAVDQQWNDPATAPGNDRIRLQRARVRRSDHAPDLPIAMDTPYDVELSYWNLTPNARLGVTLQFYNEQNIAIFGTDTTADPIWHGRELPVGLFTAVCHVPGHLMNAGTYRIRMMIVEDQTDVLFEMDNVLVFDIVETGPERGAWYGKRVGLLRPRLDWDIQYAGEDVLELI